MIFLDLIFFQHYIYKDTYLETYHKQTGKDKKKYSNQYFLEIQIVIVIVIAIGEVS